MGRVSETISLGDVRRGAAQQQERFERTGVGPIVPADEDRLELRRRFRKLMGDYRDIFPRSGQELFWQQCYAKVR